MALTEIPIELSSTPSIVDGGNATAITIDSSENVTLAEDVTFTGANATVVWDKSADSLEFADGTYLKIGTGNDLQIYHNGSNSYIKDTGTGSLIISSNQIAIQKSDNSETVAVFNEDGDVKLYYNDALKLATVTGGIDVTGTVNSTGEMRITNPSATSQLYLYGASGQKSNIVLNEYGVRAWHIGAGTFTSGELSISDGTTERLGVTTTGIDVTGILSCNNNMVVQGGGAGSQITMKDSGGTVDGYVYAESGAVGFLDDDGHWALQHTTDARTTFLINNAEKMRITSDGAVSIGTTATNGKLSIQGTGSYNSSGWGISSDLTIRSTEMSDSAYHSMLQLVAIRQSLSTGNAANGFLGFSTLDDSNNVGINDAARIAIVNEAPTSNTSAVAMSFWTNAGGSAGNAPTEKMRIDSSGNLLVGATSGSKHTISKSVASGGMLDIINSNGTAPSGTAFKFTGAAPNDGTSTFFTTADSSAYRGGWLSNGGIQNYQGNNSNLSDRREKTNFTPAKSYLDTICNIPVQTFNYIDQNMDDDDSVSLGVVAQDVQATAPELVVESNWGTEDEPKMRLSIYQTDFQYALMKCIQEQQTIIEDLKTRIETLEGE